MSQIQSASMSSSTISPYSDMHLTSGLTSTSFTTQKTIMLLHQILLQETTLRMDLEKTVRDLTREFEQMKKNQANAKTEQNITNKQLISDISSLRAENQRLKNEFQQMTNNLSNSTDRDRNLQATVLANRKNILYTMEDISKKVAFTATITTNLKSSNGQTLIFPTVISNVGGGYNNKDGVFAAPFDGTYVFFCRITGAINSGDLYFEFMLNGSAKTRNLVYSRTSVKYRTSSNLIVLQLSHRDRVWINMYQGGNHFAYGAGGDQSFSGFLL